MASIEAVVFDLDGTLITSNHDYGEMARRVKEILEDAGAPKESLGPQRRVWEIIQGGVRSLQELGLPPEKIKGILDRMDRALNDVELSSLESVEPMPGASELLESLKKRGVKTGIATRSHGEYAIKSLEATRLADYVDVVLARDQAEFPKPDPRHLLQVLAELNATPQSAIFVGDTETDQRTARAAGIPFMGVPSNERWRKRMEGKEGSVLVSSLSEITEMI
jgi:phosphoglycolate phosphatase